MIKLLLSLAITTNSAEIFGGLDRLRADSKGLGTRQEPGENEGESPSIFRKSSTTKQNAKKQQQFEQFPTEKQKTKAAIGQLPSRSRKANAAVGHIAS